MPPFTGIDPNGTAARNALPGTVPGSTPGVLLAAVRGYYKVVEVFKRYYRLIIFRIRFFFAISLKDQKYFGG